MQQPIETRTNSQFRKQYKCFDGVLNIFQKEIMTYIYDLRELSDKRHDFYDKKHHDYYAQASRKSITKVTGIGNSKVGDTIDELRKMGYLITKKTMNKGLKFFTPHFYIDTKETPSHDGTKRREALPNKTEGSSTEKNTTGGTTSVSPLEEKSTEHHTKSKDHGSTKRNNKFESENQKLNLKKSLLNRHLPAKVIESGFQFYSQYKDLFRTYGILFKAKYRATKMALKHPEDVFDSMQVKGIKQAYSYGFKGTDEDVYEEIQKAFRFEYNKGMARKLNDNFRAIIYKAEKTAKSFKKYSFGALKNYFLEQAKEQIDGNFREMMMHKTDNKIPILKA